MYCQNCGKEIENDSNVCGYCGAAVRISAEYRQWNPNQPGNYSQPNPNQPGNYSQPNPNQPQNYGQPNYNQSGYQAQGGQQSVYKPDNIFNWVAAFFPIIWSLIKGMWDLALIMIGVFFIQVIVNVVLLLIPIVGWGLAITITVVKTILVGKNANYYYRLKEQNNISFIDAVKDPNLRKV